MKNFGFVCLLLLVLSGLAFAQTGTDLWSTTAPDKEHPAVATEQVKVAATAEEESGEWVPPMALPKAASVAQFPIYAYTAPADVDWTAVEAEAAALNDEIMAIKAAGGMPSADLSERLIQQERLLFGRDHDVSSLDQGSEDCSSPTVVPSGPQVAFCESGIMGATNECTVGAQTGHRDVFYQFTPEVTGMYIISNCGSVGDLYMKIWNDMCCGAAVWKLSDDSCGGADPLAHQTLTAGVTYYFEVAYYGTTVPTTAEAYNFNLFGPLPATPAAPANDVCANAIPLTAPATVNGTTIGALTETQSITCGGTTQSYWGVYYTVVGSGHFLTASNNNACGTFNSRIRVYRGDCAALACVGGNDDAVTSNGLSSFTWCGDEGVTYFIIVSSYNSAAVYKGPFTLNVTEGGLCACEEIPLCGEPVEAEPNNTCAMYDAMELNCDVPEMFGLHCAEADSDFYRITVPAGRGMVIRVMDGEGCSTYPATKLTTRYYSTACVAQGSNSTLAKAYSRCASATDTTVYLLVLDAGAASPVSRQAYKVVIECVDPVPNDLCADAIPVEPTSSTPGNNMCGATYDVVPTCASLTPATGNGGVWFTVAGNGRILTAKTCLSSFDTKMNVYSGACDALVCVGAIDDGGLVAPCNPDGSTLSWCSNAGETYYILVYGYSATYFGTFVLEMSEGDFCAPPANDACESAIDVDVPSSTNGYTNYGSIDTPSLLCYATPTTPGVWYRVKGNGSALTAGLCTSDYNTKMNVWTGPDCATFTCVGGDNDGCDVPNALGALYTWCSLPDVDYWILVYGSSTTAPTGTFTLTIEDGGYCGAPVNDLCDGALPVAIPSQTPGDNTWATTDAPGTCTTTAPTQGLWYTVTGNDNILTATTCTDFAGTNGDTKIQVWTGDCGALTCVVGNDDQPTPACTYDGDFSTVSWCTDAGVIYYIHVGSYSTTYKGTFRLDIFDGASCHINCETFAPCGAPAEVEPNNACADIANFQTLAYNLDGTANNYYGTICPSTTDIDYWYLPATPLGAGLVVRLFEGEDCNTTPVGLRMYSATSTVDGSCTTPGTTSYTTYTLAAGCTQFNGGYLAVKKYSGYDNKYRLEVVYTAPVACPNEVVANQHSLGPCVGPIPDNTTSIYTLNVPVQYHITDLNVRVNIIHTYLADVDMFLVTPWLDTLELTTDNGSGSDHYTNTVFDDEATTSITLGTAPYTGSYQPEEALTAADNHNAAGDWQFIVIDDAGGIAGTVYCLSLEFEYDYILAVELLGGLVVTPGNTSASLVWATASETNNARFEIMRDGEIVAVKDGQGTTSSRTDYSYTDEGLSNGRTYSYSLVAVDLQGARTTVASGSVIPRFDAGTVTEYALRQNYPNPFNPTTTIGFDLLESGFVTLKVYNLMGQEVMTVVNGTMTAGRHAVAFDAATLSSGLYLYRIEANGFSAEKKMLLMK